MSRRAGLPLRVCVDARLVGGGADGGIESVVVGLAYGLSQLDEGNEEFLFLVRHGDDAWIRPYVTGPCRLLFPAYRRRYEAKRWIGRNVPLAEPTWRRLVSMVGGDPHAPFSDGTIESAEVELMHFTTQFGFLTSIPSIYHPHDLQHRHLPEYFSDREILYRDRIYKQLCDQAALVAVTSSWVKSDVEAQLDIHPSKIAVVPLASVLYSYPDPSEEELLQVRARYSLPERFVLYPAQTWAHKNHLGLLEAAALLRDERGLAIDIVCSGRRGDFFSEVDRHRRRLRLEERMRFVGFVSPLELHALYRLATAVVVPSKFEAASGPLWDAFLAGTPAACSNVTSLPKQAGDAALVFDPDSPRQIADALERLWTDAELRSTLAERGTENVSRFTWERTARHFRAHYRRIAGRALSDEDHALLSAPPLL
jgi:glycosyltransferase involved in cell wall biosynthesis